MIVLHAAWLTGSGRLALWAEGGNGRSTPGPRRRPARRIPPHPFALDPEGLRLAVSDIAGIAAADLLGEDVQLTLLLPEACGVPIASAPDDELPSTTPGGSPTFSSPWEDLSLWTAPGYVLEPPAATEFLRPRRSAPCSSARIRRLGFERNSERRGSCLVGEQNGVADRHSNIHTARRDSEGHGASSRDPHQGRAAGGAR